MLQTIDFDYADPVSMAIHQHNVTPQIASFGFQGSLPQHSAVLLPHHERIVEGCLLCIPQAGAPETLAMELVNAGGGYHIRASIAADRRETVISRNLPGPLTLRHEKSAISRIAERYKFMVPMGP